MTIAIADKKKTIFMQACGVFEDFKVVLGGVFEIETTLSPLQVFNEVKASGEMVIAVIGETVVVNSKIKAVSDGNKWATIQKFIESL